MRDQRMPVTHLNEADFDNSEVDITVDSTERFPATGAFIVQIEDELIYCTGIASDTVLTVSSSSPTGRGYLGTAAAAHARYTPVYVWGMDMFHTASSWNTTASFASVGIDTGTKRQAKTLGDA